MNDTVNPTGTESTDTSVDGAAARIESLLQDSEPKQPKGETQEAGESGETSQATESDSTETEQETSETAETKQEQKLSFQSLQELADALEVPIDDLIGSVKDKVKIQGQEKEVTLAELRKGYQMEADYRQKTSELAEQRRAFEAEQQNRMAEIQQRLTESSQMVQYLEQSLLAEYNNMDWNALRAADPAEFAARKQEYNERWQNIQNVKQQANFEAQRMAQEGQAKQQKQLQEILKTEQAKLIDAIPEWKDDAKASTERVQIRDYLKGMGFNEQEIGNVIDHRHLVILRKAYLYDNASKKAEVEKKKVVNLPKVLKPGNKPSKEDAKTQQYQALRDKLKKTGDINDAAALIMQRL